jgi:hypothetical protein
MSAARPLEDSKIQHAEEVVTANISRLENVMEELTEKVEDTSRKLQHMMDLGIRQKDELLHLKDKAEDTVLPVLRQGRDFGRNLSSKARANQEPLLYGSVALLTGWLVYRFIARRSA